MYNYSQNIQEVDKEDVDLSSFALNDRLNSKFWNGGKLDMLARRKMLTIARDFIIKFEISDFGIDDVILTGSIANYNCSEKYSDIDLHIVIDFRDINDDVILVRKFFDAVRERWNSTHKKIKIYGYPVEIYVQDVNDEHVSSGVYSVLYDEWIIEPSLDKFQKQMDDINYDYVQEIASSLMNEIEDLEERTMDIDQNTSYDEIEGLMDDARELRDRIMNARRSDLGNTGTEISTGNIIFKVLRRNGYLERLRDIRRDLYDLMHSLE